MNIYDIILILSGYSLYYCNDDDHNKTMIDIENSKKEKYKIKLEIIKMLSLIQFFIIMIILSWTTVYSLHISIYTKNVLYIGSSFFRILIIFQYISGIIYFNKSHFHKFIRINERNKKIYNIVLIISQIISLIISIYISYSIFNNYYIAESTLYKIFYNNVLTYSNKSKILIIFVFFEKLLGYNIFFVNTLSFIMVIISQKNDVTRYYEEINNNIKKKDFKKEHFTKIIYGFSEIINNYNK